MDKDQKRPDKKRNLKLVDKYDNDDYSRYAASDYAEGIFELGEEDNVHQLSHPEYPGMSSEEEEYELESNKPHRIGFSGVGPKGYKRSDEKIYEEVCEVLMQHRAIDASNIVVKISEGLVNLSGKVNSRFEKKLAEEIIEPLSGVKDIQNELSVMRGNLRLSGPEGVTKKDLGIT